MTEKDIIHDKIGDLQKNRLQKYEHTVRFADVFEIVYGGLPDKVKRQSLQMLDRSVKMLDAEGCQALWSGSGPAHLALAAYRQYRGILGHSAPALEDRFHGFSDDMQGRSDAVRAQFVMLRDELSMLSSTEQQERGIHDETKQLLETATPTPDLDITITQKTPNMTLVEDINQSPKRVLTRAVMPYLKSPEFQGGQLSQTGKKMGFSATARQFGDIGPKRTVSALTGPLIIAPDRYYLGITFQEDGANTFDIHMATAPTTAREDSAEYRLSSLVMSNERTALPLRVIDGHLHVDMSKFRSVIEHMTETLSFGRQRADSSAKIVESALRGIRKSTATYPAMADLTQSGKLFEPTTVASIQAAAEKIDTDPRLIEEARNKITLLREIMVMFAQDPHLAASLLLQTGLWKTVLGDAPPNYLYQMMLEEPMNAQIMQPLDGIPSQEIVPAMLRTPDTISQSRTIFMNNGGANGLRITHDAGTNNHKRHIQLISLDEFNDLIGIFTQRPPAEIDRGEYPLDYWKNINNALSKMAARKKVFATGQYEEEMNNGFTDLSPVYGKELVAKNMYFREFCHDMPYLWNILQQFSQEKKALINRQELFNAVQSRARDFSLPTETLIPSLWTLGLITRWGPDTFIQTPKKKLDQVLTSFSEQRRSDPWKAGLNTTQYNTLRLMLIDKIWDSYKKIYSHKTRIQKSEHTQDQRALMAAVRLADDKLPAQFFNVVSAYTNLPDTRSTESTDDLVDLYGWKSLAKITDKVFPQGYIDSLAHILEEQIRPVYGHLYTQNTEI